MSNSFVLSRNPAVYISRESRAKSFPISLKEMKLFLRIEDNYNKDDKLILNLIAMATDYAEWHMEKSLVEQRWCISYEGYIPRRIYLSYGPIKKVISATALYTVQERIDLEYSCNTTGGYIDLYNYFTAQRVDIAYDAGYDNVPEQIRSGIIQHVDILYKNHTQEISSHLSEIKKIYSCFRDLKMVL